MSTTEPIDGVLGRFYAAIAEAQSNLAREVRALTHAPAEGEVEVIYLAPGDWNLSYKQKPDVTLKICPLVDDDGHACKTSKSLRAERKL